MIFDRCQPIERLDCTGLVGLFTDIDDTLTREGKLEAACYAALWQLHDAGYRIVPVTGRSAGWAHMILKTWPVHAVIAESGGLYLCHAAPNLRLHAPEHRIRADRQRIHECALQIMHTIPGLRPASDNAYRLVDYALDYCEEVARVDASQVQRAIEGFHDAGFSARSSSVHINAWVGDFDKGPMALRMLDELFVDADRTLAEPDRWVFVGDAPNDASMFASFRHSVGVANLVPHLDQLPVAPAYLTHGGAGAGFLELARQMLAARPLPKRGIS